MVTRRDRHGGNIHAASRESNLPRDRILDFSASVNPLGPSPRSRRALAQSARATAHYPDPDCVELRRALARRYRLRPDHLLIGNGSSELIHLLPLALPMAHVLIVGPTFSEYERAVRISGGRVTRLLAGRRLGYRPPLADVADRLREGARRPPVDAVFLCNPNSPTGQAVARNRLLSLVEVAARRGVLTVVDETFVDYCEERSLVSRVGRQPHLLVLRSFTKFYGLAGLRVGYLAGHHDLVRRVTARQPPWSVNALAQEAALAGLSDARYAARSRAHMARERVYLATRLRSLGVTVYPSDANFLMVELTAAHAADRVTRALRARGILIRDLSSVPGLTRHTIRVAVRTRREHRRLLTALSAVLRRRSA